MHWYAVDNSGPDEDDGTGAASEDTGVSSSACMIVRDEDSPGIKRVDHAMGARQSDMSAYCIRFFSANVFLPKILTKISWRGPPTPPIVGTYRYVHIYLYMYMYINVLIYLSEKVCFNENELAWFQ